MPVELLAPEKFALQSHCLSGTPRPKCVPRDVVRYCKISSPRLNNTHADAGLFVGDDDGIDKDATTEMFMVIGGLSTIAFALSFNVPFIVAPSVLYASRGSGYAPRDGHETVH